MEVLAVTVKRIWDTWKDVNKGQLLLFFVGGGGGERRRGEGQRGGGGGGELTHPGLHFSMAIWSKMRPT